MDHIFRFHTNIYKEKGKFIMKKITRRSFLAAMGIVGASAALTACGGSSASSVASSTATSATASTAAGSAAAKPDGYPNTSMTLVVGFGAGGDTDLNNRLMAQYVEPSFGQSIAVTNMAGSNGSVAMTQYQSTPPTAIPSSAQIPLLSSTTLLPAPASTAIRTTK